MGLTDCPEGPGPLDSRQRVAADSCTLAQNGRSDSHHEVPSAPPYHTLRALWATAATAATPPPEGPSTPASFLGSSLPSLTAVPTSSQAPLLSSSKQSRRDFPFWEPGEDSLFLFLPLRSTKALDITGTTKTRRPGKVAERKGSRPARTPGPLLRFPDAARWLVRCWVCPGPVAETAAAALRRPNTEGNSTDLAGSLDFHLAQAVTQPPSHPHLRTRVVSKRSEQGVGTFPTSG